MGTGRLEAFSDGVIAVAITIMVLELKAPEHADSFSALHPLFPALLSYILSFVYIGIYWNNHHHLMHAAKHVSGAVLWANLHLLFWISLIPFVTSWTGDTGFSPRPVALYGGVLLMSAVAWLMLEAALLKRHGPESALAGAIRRGRKERVSVAVYALGTAIAISGCWLEPPDATVHWAGASGALCYAIVAAIWFVPDKRLEKAVRLDGRDG